MAGTPQFHDPKISGQVTARADGADYVINGQKAAWVSNGTIATHALTYLTLDPSKGLAGGGVAFIPLNLPGVSKGKPLDKMGQRALNQGGFTFTNVRIPKRYMLFDTASYEAILNQTLALTNGAMGAIFTGVARAAYEHALVYAKTRLQGGKPISEHQLVQKHLFDMFTKVETRRRWNTPSRPTCIAHRPVVKSPIPRCNCSAARASRAIVRWKNFIGMLEPR